MPWAAEAALPARWLLFMMMLCLLPGGGEALSRELPASLPGRERKSKP